MKVIVSRLLLCSLIISSTLALNCIDIDGSLGSTITAAPAVGFEYGFQTTIYESADVSCSYLSYNGFSI